MDCQICGSSEFCTRAGITYCTECNSQIEETQTETNVDFVQSSKDLLSSSFVKKTTREEDTEFSGWITAECYNYIIFMQVSALIKLGASPKLKDSVLHIWTKYLQKCEIAFRTDYQAQAGDNTPRLGPAPYLRDIKVSSENKKIPRYKRKRNQVKSSGKSSCSSETSGEESNVSESDSSGLTSDTDSTVSSVAPKKKAYSCHTRKLYRKGSLNSTRRESYKSKVFNMRIQKTLSFCYLGLLYSEDTLSLCDLIRFVYEDKVPYLVINDKLPTFFKFQFKDTVTFLRYHVPEASEIYKTALQIVEFLKLPRFKEPSIHLAVSRFVKDLNLPDGINPIVKILVKSYEEKISKFTKRPKLKDEPIDYQAICFVIIALKMLFVLDNKFENEHSKSMKQLNAIHPDKNYFVWQEWREHSMIKEYLFLPETPGTYNIGKVDSLSSDKMISKYPFTGLKPKNNNAGRYIAERCDIQNVLSNIVHIPEKISILPTSFPLRTGVNGLIQEWNTMPLFKETEKIDFTVLQRDFSACSLNYDPEQFDESEEELSYLLMSALYSPGTVLNSTKFSHVPFLHQIALTTTKHWFMIFPNMNRECHGSQHSKVWFQKLPPSFKWLMNFLSKYIYCDNTYLYKNAALIENALFFDKQSLNSQRNSKIKNKVIVNF